MFPAQATPGEQPRAKLAVGFFEIPESLSKDVSAATLTNLVLDAVKTSKHFELVLPDIYVSEVIKNYRTQLQIGAPGLRDKIDPDKIKADYLLLPAVAKTGNSILLTAALIDARTVTLKKMYKVKLQGNMEQVEELVQQLWNAISLFPVRWESDIKSTSPLGVQIGNKTLCFTTRKEMVVLDSTHGKILWKRDVEGFPYHIVDDQRVYYTSGQPPKKLTAADLKTGAVLWTVPLEGQVYPSTVNSEMLILSQQDNFKETALIGLRKKDGTKAWNIELPRFGDGHTGPFLLNNDQLIRFSLSYTDNKWMHRAFHFDLKLGQQSMMRDFTDDIPEKVRASIGYRGITTQLYNGVIYVLTSSHEPDRSTSTYLLSFKPDGKDGRLLHLADRIGASSYSRQCISFLGNNAYVLVNKNFLKRQNGPGRAMSLESIEKIEHHIFGCGIQGRMQRFWETQIESQEQPECQAIVVGSRFVYVGVGDLYALDRRTGKLMAKYDLAGTLASLKLDGDTLYLATKDCKLIAIDANP